MKKQSRKKQDPEQPISKSIKRVIDRLPESVPVEPKPTADDQRWLEEVKANAILREQNDLLRKVGPRYHDVTLGNYKTTTDESQFSALGKILTYEQNIADEIRGGRGILLYGEPGTGKDHLLIGLAKRAIAGGYDLTWVNGVEIHARMREIIGTDTSERTILDEYKQPKILVLSDPVPPRGSLTDYQATTLYRLIDHRYRYLHPTWVSLNVSGLEEARQRMGKAAIDRLRDGALAIACGWDSYRKARD